MARALPLSAARWYQALASAMSRGDAERLLVVIADAVLRRHEAVRGGLLEELRGELQVARVAAAFGEAGRHLVDRDRIARERRMAQPVEARSRSAARRPRPCSGWDRRPAGAGRSRRSSAGAAGAICSGAAVDGIVIVGALAAVVSALVRSGFASVAEGGVSGFRRRGLGIACVVFGSSGFGSRRAHSAGWRGTPRPARGLRRWGAAAGAASRLSAFGGAAGGGLGSPIPPIRRMAPSASTIAASPEQDRAAVLVDGPLQAQGEARSSHPRRAPGARRRDGRSCPWPGRRLPRPPPARPGGPPR